MIPARFAKVRAIYGLMCPTGIPTLANLLPVNAKKLKGRKRDGYNWKIYPTLVHFVTKLSKTLKSIPLVYILECRMLLMLPVSLLRIPTVGSSSLVQMVAEKLTGSRNCQSASQ